MNIRNNGKTNSCSPLFTRNPWSRVTEDIKERSVRLMATRLTVLLVTLLGLIPAVCRAQDFSADVVYLPTRNLHVRSGGGEISEHHPSKLYVSKDKMRLETRGLVGTILLVNGEEQTAFALFPLKKEYQPLDGGLSEYFRVRDAENACPDWQRSAAQKIDCEKVGHEVIDGRQTVKYQNKGASDFATSVVWIDTGLDFVIKWEGASTGVELQNIQEALQPMDLFILPADYEIPKPRKGTNKGFSKR